MLLFAVFLAVTGSAQAGVRVVIVHDGELLRSEQHFVAAVKKASSAAVEEATPAEAAFVREGGALPDVWRGLATVVVVSVVPPLVDKKGVRYSRGLGGVLVFHPPSATPIYAEKADIPERRDAGSDVGLDDALAKWIARLTLLPSRPSP
jgi:hypothetical protein